VWYQAGDGFLNLAKRMLAGADCWIFSEGGFRRARLQLLVLHLILTLEQVNGQIRKDLREGKRGKR